eukprot:6177093-Pleurochrysis_carterae.AAC.1
MGRRYSDAPVLGVAVGARVRAGSEVCEVWRGPGLSNPLTREHGRGCRCRHRREHGRISVLLCGWCVCAAVVRLR